MKWLTAVAAFLGRFFKEILPELFAEARKPTKTTQAGGDRELQKDVNEEINRQLEELWAEEEPAVIKIVCQKCAVVRTVIAGDLRIIDAGCTCGGSYRKLDDD